MQRSDDGTPLIVRNALNAESIKDLAWEPFREGIEIHRIYVTPGGSASAFLRYAPGAALPRHVHSGYEHILVVSGSQIDDAGEHFAGTFIVYRPGSSHAIRSPQGCIVLITWEKPVRFVADPSETPLIGSSAQR